jgi:hypothetical protein
MELEAVDLDQIGEVDGLFDDFALQAVDLNGTGIAAAGADCNTDTSSPSVDEASFAMDMQARLEAAMQTAVQEIAAENGEDLEMVNTDGGLQIVNLGARATSASDSSTTSPGCCSWCVPKPQGTCAQLISKMLYIWGWLSHLLAALDVGWWDLFARRRQFALEAWGDVPAMLPQLHFITLVVVVVHSCANTFSTTSVMK